MPSWSDLSHAYGPGTDIPALLDQAEQDPCNNEVWGELTGRLFHQGTVYNASYAALPRLTQIASAEHPDDEIQGALLLATWILGSRDGADDPAQVQQRYASEINTLKGIADRLLLGVHDHVSFAYYLQARLSLDRDWEQLGTGWLQIADDVTAKEVAPWCPSCNQPLAIDLEATPYEVVPFDGEACRSIVALASPDDLPPAAARAYDIAHNRGQAKVANTILLLDGQTACPLCKHTFLVREGLG